jgi:alpha-galactosidase
MPIKYYIDSKEFHLYNNQISYFIKILENGQLGNLYFGKKIGEKPSFGHFFEKATRDMSAYLYEGDSSFSLENIKQEYPISNSGDVRYPALIVSKENGSTFLNPVYHSHKIYKGKKKLDGLPAVFSKDINDTTSLEIVLEDASTKLQIILKYSISEKLSAITRSVEFCNKGSQTLTIEKAMSACLDLPSSDFDMFYLSGAWCRERHIKRRHLEYGETSIQSLRGCSSHQFNPFLGLCKTNSDEMTGEVYGFSFVYSGNFLAQVEVDNYDVSRVLFGIHPQGFSWNLAESESFQTPELIMTYTEHGFNEMSQNFHNLFNNYLINPRWQNIERPILINSWEALYFDYDEKDILDLAERAKSVGIELFVLDDGWFGKRNDDKSSLGDWYVNKEKIPSGIDGLSNKINHMGLKFGLWIEPEMVNKQSNLFKKHPNWILGEMDENICHSRNQYILDFSQHEVRDYIYEELINVLNNRSISYIKWDMNRSFAQTFSNLEQANNQGKIMHKYILGVYELYEKLTSKYPNILFESCASGGARFDSGMLFYAPQCWTSDNTDSIDRLKIQYGTSLVYPLSCIGSHVSASPNHQTKRSTSLQTRAEVAYFGTFGYELNLRLLDGRELKTIKKQIAFKKLNQKLFSSGTFYRLIAPFDNKRACWMVVSEDKTETIIGYYKILNDINCGFKKIKLLGLNPLYEYIDLDTDETYNGDELMYYGYILSDESSGIKLQRKELSGDFTSTLIHLKAIKNKKK